MSIIPSMADTPGSSCLCAATSVPRAPVAPIARQVLTAFLFTFIAARVLVILIMTRRMPDLFLHVGQTHVHHLNYGIFLLAGVGAYLLFRRPEGRSAALCAWIYGIGLGLTFDEFGMWVHLGGSYWQRASFDAVIVIAGLLGLIGFAPTLHRLRPRHWAVALLLLVAVACFAWLLVDSVQRVGRHYAPRLREIEQSGPQ